jgi:hypothetical protein
MTIIVSDGIAVSSALNTDAASMTGVIKVNSFSAINFTGSLSTNQHQFT